MELTDINVFILDVTFGNLYALAVHIYPCIYSHQSFVKTSTTKKCGVHHLFVLECPCSSYITL